MDTVTAGANATTPAACTPLRRPRCVANPGTSNSNTDSVESALLLLDRIKSSLLTFEAKGVVGDDLAHDIARLNHVLQKVGPQLMAMHAEAVEKAMDHLTLACKKPGLDMATRLLILRILELKTLGWVSNDHFDNYYKQKLKDLEDKSRKESACVERPFSEDRQKAVSGDTVISDKGDCLRESGLHESQIVIGADTIYISGRNLDLVQAARKLLVSNLQDNWNKMCESNGQESFALSGGLSDSLSVEEKGSRRSYSREILLGLAASPLSQECPSILRENDNLDLVGRSSDSHHELPLDWQRAFENSSTFVLGCRPEYGEKIKMSGNYSAKVLESMKKKNFLEVLCPNARPRVWDDAIGEWVETDEAFACSQTRA